MDERAARIVDLYRRGDVSADVAIARLFVACKTATEVDRALREHGDAFLLGALHRRSSAFVQLEAIVALADAAGEAGPPDAARTPDDARQAIARTAELFDRCVVHSEEASVALYSLGSAETLEAATRELVQLFDGWGLLGRGRDVLDFGCGVGRLAGALAPLVREVQGVDVSREMVARAQRRWAHAANVCFTATAGRDLGAWPDGRFDVVLAVDSMPYVVAAGAGLAADVVREAGRVLRPGGELVVLNWSYRGDPGRDAADATSAAAAAGLEVVACAERTLRLWDGDAYRLRRS